MNLHTHRTTTINVPTARAHPPPRAMGGINQPSAMTFPPLMWTSMS